MFFLDEVGAPVVIQFGKGKFLTIEKLLMPDITAWASLIAAKRYEDATKNMDDVRKREYATFYPMSQPDLNEIKRLLRTPDGVAHVLDNRLPTAKVTDSDGKNLGPLSPEQIETLKKANGTGKQAALAWLLADVDDVQALSDYRRRIESESSTDPLSPRGKQGPSVSQPIGQNG